MNRQDAKDAKMERVKGSSNCPDVGFLGVVGALAV
jgi:hypothetical protein